MLARLAALREAPVVEPFSGPALLSGRAAAAFHPGLGEEVTVSLIVPDLLFEELEIRKSRETFGRPPVVPPPLAAPTPTKAS